MQSIYQIGLRTKQGVYNMEKIINGFFSILKFLLLLISFMVTFYIIMSMYQRLEKNIIECIPTMLPYVILLFLFIFSYYVFRIFMTYVSLLQIYNFIFTHKKKRLVNFQPYYILSLLFCNIFQYLLSCNVDLRSIV